MKKLLLAGLAFVLGLTLLGCNAKPVVAYDDWLSDGETVTQIAAGGSHALFLTSEGNVIVVGDNAMGQLGIGLDKPSIKGVVNIVEAFGLATDEAVIQIGAGDTYSFALTDLGRLFVWGTGLLDSGEGYLLPEDVTDLIPLFGSERLLEVHVSKYDGVLAAVTSLDRYVQIRPVKDASPFVLETVHLLTFFTLQTGETIEDYAITSNAFQAVTASGRLVALTFDTIGVTEDDYYPFTDLTQGFTLQNHEKVVSVVNAYSVSYVLTSNGRMFGWGLNDRGQLGIVPDAYKITPAEIGYMFQLPTGETIETFDAFLDFGLALSSVGNVYTWGYSLYEESDGTWKKPSLLIPKIINEQLSLHEGETVLILKAGRRHAYFATSEGRVLIWTLPQE